MKAPTNSESTATIIASNTWNLCSWFFLSSFVEGPFDLLRISFLRCS
jgi:hypothetical protein